MSLNTEPIDSTESKAPRRIVRSIITGLTALALSACAAGQRPVNSETVDRTQFRNLGGEAVSLDAGTLVTAECVVAGDTLRITVASGANRGQVSEDVHSSDLRPTGNAYPASPGQDPYGSLENCGS